MRLTKKVKVRLNAYININLTEKIINTVKVKKYAGEVTVINNEYHNSKQYFEIRRDIGINIYDVITQAIKNSLDVNDIYEVDRNIEITAGEPKKIDRTTANITYTYSTHLKFKIPYIIYGTLVFNGSNNFEDCFETTEGEKITDIIHDSELALIKKYIKEKSQINTEHSWSDTDIQIGKKADYDKYIEYYKNKLQSVCEVSVNCSYDDDVELIDGVSEDLDDLKRELEDKFDGVMYYQNPEDE